VCVRRVHSLAVCLLRVHEESERERERERSERKCETRALTSLTCRVLTIAHRGRTIRGNDALRSRQELEQHHQRILCTICGRPQIVTSADRPQQSKLRIQARTEEVRQEEKKLPTKEEMQEIFERLASS
jgi:hypothetical protein